MRGANAERSSASSFRQRRHHVQSNWDSVVIQHFGSHPTLQDNVRESVFHNQEPFSEPRDVSDFASASAIIDLLLSRNPGHGRAFIYKSWPGTTGAADFRKRVREEMQQSLEAQGLPRDEVLQKVRERKPTLEEMTPLMRDFDFTEEWLARLKWVKMTTSQAKAQAGPILEKVRAGRAAAEERRRERRN